MRTAFRNCPVCEHDQIDVLHTQRFELMEGHPLLEGYDVVSCDYCGFVYADTTITQADFDRFYAEQSKYEDSKTGTGGVMNSYDWRRQQETARQIDEFLGDPNTKIMDVGCANGGLLKALQDRGYQNLLGIDPSPVCVQNTRELGINARVGSLSSRMDEAGFGCVILSHVLEHVQDIKSALGWIEPRLHSRGVIFLETPDAGRYVDFLYAPFQDFNTEHINHFSLRSLDNLMRVHGLLLAEGGEKDLEAGINIYYPSVYGFWRHTNPKDTVLVKDMELSQNIKRYIHHSQEILNRIQKRIDRALIDSPRLIVWGTGQLAMKLFVETSLAKARIVALVDNNPINHGKNLHGMSILAPHQISQLDAPILVTTILHQQAIATQIRSMGLKNEIILIGDNL